MASINFSVRLDEEVKRQFDEFCNKIGITSNAAISLFANRVVAEKRIPFEIVDVEARQQQHQWILEQLNEREKMANDPNAQWLTQDEVMGKFRDKYVI